LKQYSCALSAQAIKKHVQNEHKFLHMGAVQRGIKPLFRLGLDVPMEMLDHY
jgi:hypothetical protein